MDNSVRISMKIVHFVSLMQRWVGGKKIMFTVIFLVNPSALFFLCLDVSTNEFPANYFERNAIYFKNHDMYNNPLSMLKGNRLFSNWIRCVYSLVHFVVRVFNRGEEDNDRIKRFLIYHFERHVRRNPGRKLVILFDLTDTGLKNLVRYSPVLHSLFNPLLSRIMIWSNLSLAVANSTIPVSLVDIKSFFNLHFLS